ncbi:MAG TPA: ABC transporter family substrate-binding protein [Pseudolysinimonas sp.]
MRLRILAALAIAPAIAVAASMTLAGCAANSDVVAGSEIVVAVTDAFTSVNPDTSYGRGSETNADVALLTSTGFGYVDAQGSTTLDTSFGSAQLLSRDPFTVKYTVNQGVDWSDGTSIDATDLLLAWAANSGALNTAKFDDSLYVDATTGFYIGDFPKDVVYFDGRVGGGLEKAPATPIIGDDGRSITVTFDSALPDWSTVLEPGVPAHLLAIRALHTKAGDVAAGKTAVLDAIQKKDAPHLHALAQAWNNAYNLIATPHDHRLLVSSGPYSITKVSGTRVVLTANPVYTGSRRPSFETVILRVSPDPLETTQLLASGAVDIATPQPSEKTAAALAAIPDVTVTTGTEARFEHLDLQFAKGKHTTFQDARVRQAFLDVVPRAQIVSQLSSTDAAGGGEQGAKVLDSFVLRFGTAAYDDAIQKNGSVAYDSPDLEAATQLLDAAGATNPEVCILYDPSNRRRVAEFQLIQTSAARAGFVVTDCSSPDWQGLLGVDGSYDAALFAWDTTRLGVTAQASVFRSDAALANFNHFSDPDSDALITQLSSTDDPATQTALLTKLDTRIWSLAYGMPLYAYPTLTAVDSRVTGVTRSSLAGSVFWNAWEWKPATASGAPSNGP